MGSNFGDGSGPRRYSLKVPREPQADSLLLYIKRFCINLLPLGAWQVGHADAVSLEISVKLDP